MPRSKKHGTYEHASAVSLLLARPDLFLRKLVERSSASDPSRDARRQVGVLVFEERDDDESDQDQVCDERRRDRRRGRVVCRQVFPASTESVSTRPPGALPRVKERERGRRGSSRK